jgi:hypothetical protein
MKSATRRWPAGYLWIVCPSVVAIALLLLLFQQGFGFFNLSAKFFYLCPQVLYFALFVLYFLLSAGQCRTQERLSLCNENELAVFLAKRIFQRSNTGEIVLVHDPIYNAVMNIVSALRQPVQFIEEHGEL